MSVQESGNRYSEICGATNNRGNPCKLPAGWGTPGSGGSRCKFHGGSSSGPDDTSHLENNDYAKNNPGGRPPEGNGNAVIHGGFSDWQTAYRRFDSETKAYVGKLVDSILQRARETVPDMDSQKREQLAREKAVCMVLEQRTAADVWCSGPGRGITVEKEVETTEGTYIVEAINPAFGASISLSSRQREIAKELRLWPGFRD